jgi:hypothetical protein
MDFELFPVTSNNSVRKRISVEVSVELDDPNTVSDECKNVLFQRRIENLGRFLRHGQKDAET